MPWKRSLPPLVTLLLNIGFLLRPSLSTSTTPPVLAVRGQMDWPIMGIRPPSPSDLVKPLCSLSLHQTLDRGKPLPSLVLSPPSSPTLPPARLCRTSLWALDRGSKKDQASPYTSTKHRARCGPSLVATKGKLEAMKVFQKLQKDLGMGVALESFQKVLAAIDADMFHDAVGCPNCRICGDWEFCKRSRYHPQLSGVQPGTHWPLEV